MGKVKTPNVLSSTVEVDSEKLSASVSFLSDAKSPLSIEDIVKQAKGRVKVRYPHIGTKRNSVTVAGVTGDKENIEVVEQDYDVCIAQKKKVSGDGEDMDVNNMFGFKTPKKPKSSGKTPSKSHSAVEGTPSTPSTVRRSSRARGVEVTTPYRLVSRMDDADMSDDSIDSDGSEDSSVDGTVDDVLPADRSSTQHLPNMAEDFFNAQSSKQITSNHTLARLREDGALDQTSLKDILSVKHRQYNKGVKLLMAEHRSMFRSWMLQLCLGFNLILYGYGSKKSLIEEFRKTFCSGYHCVVINGFFPSITLKNILASIYEDCLQLSNQSTDTDDVINSIDSHLKKKDEALFLFIHNIDGLMLRMTAVQTMLASLSSLDNVHVIASIDHINTPLMWNQSCITKYKWLWYDGTTYEPYMEELSYETSLLTQQSGALALRSMVNVYKSLTPNAKSIFLLMANYHMEHCSAQSYIGIPFQRLYQKCRENFLVNSDQTLRTQLTEFRDHKLIRSRKGVDGAEHIFLPTDSSTLKDFLDQVSTLDT